MVEEKKTTVKESVTSDNTKDVPQKIHQLKGEISVLSSKLRDFSEEKEKQYQEKETIDKELNNKIKEAQEFKEKKEDIDKKIKVLKTTRDKYNQETKKIFNDITEIKKKLGIEMSKLNSKKIQEKIDALQYTVETEVLSVGREKKYMAEIKKLRVKLSEIEEEEKKFSELKELKDKLKEKKEAADKLHVDIQNLANQSSKIFQQLTEKSKEISKIKGQKSSIRDKLKGIKKQINDLNKRLADALKKWSSSKGKAPSLGKLFTKKKKTQKMGVDELMKDIKGKKKLTKEDLLALQKKLG